MNIFIIRTLCLWLLFCLLTASASAHPKISKDLEQANPSLPVNVIVQYRPGVSLLKTVLNGVTGLVGQLPLVNAVIFRILPPQALTMVGDSDVEYISLDRGVRAKLDYANPAFKSNLAFTAGVKGKGITVAVIDSGIGNHADLRGGLGLLSRIAYQESFVPGELTGDDRFGHGTHVAGIIAGDGSRSTGSNFKATFRGLAPAARLMNLRVLNGEGKGTDSAVIAAIHRAILLKTLFNVKVLNLSLGRPVWESYIIQRPRYAGRWKLRGKQASSWWFPQVMRGGITPPEQTGMARSARPLIAHT